MDAQEPRLTSLSSSFQARWIQAWYAKYAKKNGQKRSGSGTCSRQPAKPIVPKSAETADQDSYDLVVAEAAREQVMVDVMAVAVEGVLSFP